MAYEAKIIQTIERERIKIIRFVWIGNDGVIRAKASTAKHLKSHIKRGIGIAKGIQSFNALDHLVLDGSFGAPAKEFQIFPDLKTFKILPYAKHSACFICELLNPDFEPSATDARAFLRRIISQAKEMGFLPMAAGELEYYLTQRDDSGNIIPQNNEKYGTTTQYDLANDVIQDWLDTFEKMDLDIERVISEYGGAQYEITIRYTEALTAADNILTFKDAAKGVALNHGYSTTFLPMPFPGGAGSGMHFHISLWDLNEKNNLFYSESDEYFLSGTAKYFVGGIMAHLKGLCAVCAPNPNSYKRLLPHSWAPAHCIWGVDNRAAAIRIPTRAEGDGPEPTRIEFRVPDGTANPYFALGVTLACGLEGIKKKIEPPEPVHIEPGDLMDDDLEKKGIEYLPRTLGEALAEFKKDAFFKEIMGDFGFNEFYKVRMSEWREYCSVVTDWELKNYRDTF